MPPAQVDLTPFGFTGTESAVYGALLRSGPATGYAVAEIFDAAASVPEALAHSSVRLTLGHDTTDADIDRVVETLPRVVAALRELSPHSPRDRTALAAWFTGPEAPAPG